MIKEDPKNKGTFIVSFGKRHPITRQSRKLSRKGIKTMSEAKRVYNQLVLLVEERIKQKTIPKWSTILGNFADASRNRGVSEGTVTNYLLCLNAHTVEDWGDRFVDTITSQEIRELISRKVGHRSQSHQKNLLKFIRAVFNYALESGVINKSPVPQMKFQIGDKIKCVLTEDQVRHFLNRAKDLDAEWYPHWAMASYTGMRNGELYALTWSKVNLDDRLIKVDTSWNNKNGFKSTKSGDDRQIEIAPNLIPILRELKIKNFDSNFVLPRIEKWDKGEQARELRLFLKGIGLPTIRFHDLRASWATIMLTKGVEPIKVMSMGGWKDLKTMQFYIRKAGINIRGITDALDLHNPSKEVGKVLNFGPSL